MKDHIAAWHEVRRETPQPYALGVIERDCAAGHRTTADAYACLTCRAKV